MGVREMSSRGKSGRGAGRGTAPRAEEGPETGGVIDQVFSNGAIVGWCLVYGLMTAFILGWFWYAGIIADVVLAWPPVVQLSTPAPDIFIWFPLGILGVGWVVLVGGLFLRQLVT